jgi:transcription initiation factor TFIIIB Brf1 subunit/transcription initiation factor TFIIB
MKLSIQCEECDSEYTIEYEEGLIADEPKYCLICGSIIEPEFFDEADTEEDD